MKKILFIILLAISAIHTNAQSDSVYAELGVNVIRIVNLGLGSQTLDYDTWNPYMLTANVNYKRIGLRLGIGNTNKSRTELPVDANGLSTTRMDTARTDFRIGLGWEVELASKWTFKFGADYYMANSSNTFETKYMDEADQTIEINRKIAMNESGISPFVFIQYHVTPRVSLGTELMWRFGSFTAEDGEVSTTTPEFGDPMEIDITRKFEGKKSGIMAPTALFLNFRF